MCIRDSHILVVAQGLDLQHVVVGGDLLQFLSLIHICAAVARAHMEAVKRRLKEAKNAKDEDVLVSLQLVNEMLSRGYAFLPIERGKSRGNKYIVEEMCIRDRAKPLSLRYRSAAPLIGEPLAGRRVFVV